VIVAAEKGIAFERVDIDLANKPDWFLAISPTGKVPLLEVDGVQRSTQYLFESAVIAEYLDEISGRRLLPENPLARARERSWIEIASAALADIARLYSAPNAEEYSATQQALGGRLSNLDAVITGPWFSGETFGLVDAAYAPMFRYIDIFERHMGRKLIDRTPRLAAWTRSLAERPSVIAAVPSNYEERLLKFVDAKQSHLARQLIGNAIAA
jgi:glutathione S-transferase